ncbi:expressed unknown protein [Seminavis robusta]|uniref:Uncharacterized protein n=1 Tax=Seminavis robusta TaxID=568900 RepID=A0A9N8DI50_9STRA|nr:expressed unknown protein [Seminavis robusta]|eukprot:Sro101_g051840.1 n/a (100) ;mRNA; r:119235-119534
MAGTPRQVALGGLNDLWMIDEWNDIWYMKLNWQTLATAAPWEKVDGKMWSISATASGAVFGVATDGKNVLYCPFRAAALHDLRCDFIDGPLESIQTASI